MRFIAVGSRSTRYVVVLLRSLLDLHFKWIGISYGSIDLHFRPVNWSLSLNIRCHNQSIPKSAEPSSYHKILLKYLRNLMFSFHVTTAFIPRKYWLRKNMHFSTGVYVKKRCRINQLIWLSTLYRLISDS